jgi:hypothetical protein
MAKRCTILRADGCVEIHSECILCGLASVVTAPIEGYKKWLDGAMVQEAFPELPAGQRETIQSGMHEKCFDEAFEFDEFEGETDDEK